MHTLFKVTDKEGVVKPYWWVVTYTVDAEGKQIARFIKRFDEEDSAFDLVHYLNGGNK